MNFVPSNAPGALVLPVWDPVDPDSSYVFQYINPLSANGYNLGTFTTNAKGYYNGPVLFGTTPTKFKFAPGTVIPSMSFSINNGANTYSEFLTGVTTKLETDRDDD